MTIVLQVEWNAHVNKLIENYTSTKGTATFVPCSVAFNSMLTLSKLCNTETHTHTNTILKQKNRS